MLDFYKRVCASTHVPHTPVYMNSTLHYDNTNIKESFKGGIILPDNSVFDMGLSYKDNFAAEYLGPDTGITNPTELFTMALSYKDNFATEYLGPDTGITNPTELFDMTLIYKDNFATEFI